MLRRPLIRAVNYFYVENITTVVKQGYFQKLLEPYLVSHR